MKQTHKPYWALALLTGLLLIGCGQTNPLAPKPGSRLIEFDLTKADHGWIGEFVDLPVNDDGIYELEYDPRKTLPDELGTGHAAYIQSMNRSDDVFMFLKRRIDGLEPSTAYRAYIEVRFATNVPAGLAGVGGAPGESVFFKVGASIEEPVPTVETGAQEDYHRLNVDKGGQSEGGANAVVVGNVAKTSGDETFKYEYKTLNNADHPISITTDANGSAWIFVGTDSGFEGLTGLYYTTIKVVFEPK